MFYRRRASPKHRYNIIEEDYGEVGHRTRLIDLKDQLLLCLWGAPCPRIYRSKGGGDRPMEEARQGGSPTPTGSRTPPFPYSRRKEEEREKEKGAAPLVQFGPEGGRGPPSF